MGYEKEKFVVDLSDASCMFDLAAKISSVFDSGSTSNKEVYLDLGALDLKQSQLLSIKALIETTNSKLSGIRTKSEITEASAQGLGLMADSLKEKKPEPDISNIEPYHNNILSNNEELKSFSQLKKISSTDDFSSDTAKLREVKNETKQEHDIDSLSKKDNDLFPSSQESQNNSILEPDQNIKSDKAEKNIYAALEKEQELKPQEELQSALDAAFGIKPDNSAKQDEAFETFAPPGKLNEPDRNYEKTEITVNNDDNKYVRLDTEGITPEGLELIKMNTSDLPTLYLNQTLRSGQTISYEGNIFVVGDTHPGSEVIATGDITVWGIIGGIVHAGSKGNTDAKVRALKLNPIQLRIANIYSVRNDTVNVPYVQRTNEFTPEEARIDKERIVIYKTLRRED